MVRCSRPFSCCLPSFVAFVLLFSLDIDEIDPLLSSPLSAVDDADIPDSARKPEPEVNSDGEEIKPAKVSILNPSLPSSPFPAHNLS
jgi:hypothetical protein